MPASCETSAVGEVSKCRGTLFAPIFSASRDFAFSCTQPCIPVSEAWVGEFWGRLLHRKSRYGRFCYFSENTFLRRRRAARGVPVGSSSQTVCKLDGDEVGVAVADDLGERETIVRMVLRKMGD